MGVAEINDDAGTLTISANLYFYGDAANDELAFQIGEDINTQWNIPGAAAAIHGKKYKVIFDVKGLFAAHLTQADVNSNDNPLNNYFRIENHASGNISFVDGIGSNTGYFLLENLINNSTTAAHEFGHTIGLSHPHVPDIRGRGVPGIMYPRGTICDAEFHYDLHAQPGAKGGTMNPFYRKVLKSDIDDLNLGKLKYNEDGRAVIGDFTSEWHYRHQPPDES